jgi:hypothetical protein
MQLMVALKPLYSSEEGLVRKGGKFVTHNPDYYIKNKLAYKYVPQSYKTMEVKKEPRPRRRKKVENTDNDKLAG